MIASKHVHSPCLANLGLSWGIFAVITIVLVLSHAFPLYGQQPGEPMPTERVSGLERAQRKLALHLVAPSASQGENFVCSPHDLYLTLALLTLAADGSSQQELLSALSTSSLDKLRDELSEHDQIGLPARFALGALVKPGPNSQGLLINTQPDPDSALAQAGFQENDLLTHANGVPLKVFQQLAQILSLTCGELNLRGIRSKNGEAIAANVQLSVHRQLVPVAEKPFVSSRVLLTSARISPTDDYIKQAKALTPIYWVKNALGEEGNWRESVVEYIRTNSAGRVDPATILNAVPATDDKTIDFVIANSSSYQESWQRPFIKKREKEPFYSASGTQDVEMMIRLGQFYYAQQADAHVVEIPLDSCLNRVRIWLPAAESNLTTLLERLSTTDASIEIANNLQRRPIQLTLPLFHLESTIGGQRLKRSLNLNHIFSENAELNGLSTDSMIGVISQNASFDCREDGIRASSATRIIGIPKGSAPDSLELTINRPFYFELIETSGAVLYAGVVQSPVSGTTEPHPPEKPPTLEPMPGKKEPIKPEDSDLPTGSADV